MGFGIIGGLDPRIGTIKAYQMNSDNRDEMKLRGRSVKKHDYHTL